jgi:hypothetical protein
VGVLGNPKPVQKHKAHARDDSASSAMNDRGEKGMGFSQTTTTHHFLLSAEGGVIQPEENDPTDTATRDNIRMHLMHIAKAFSTGDFAIPMFVHDTVPPGVPVMKEHSDKIRYKFEKTPAGGRVVRQVGDSLTSAKEAEAPRSQHVQCPDEEHGHEHEFLPCLPRIRLDGVRHHFQRRNRRVRRFFRRQRIGKTVKVDLDDGHAYKKPCCEAKVFNSRHKKKSHKDQHQNKNNVVEYFDYAIISRVHRAQSSHLGFITPEEELEEFQ